MRLRIRRRDRWQVPVALHPPFPESPSRAAGIHPAFITQVSARRKLKEPPKLAWLGGVAAPAVEPVTSYTRAAALKRRSTAFDTLKVDAAFLALFQPTAEGYPSWLSPPTLKRTPTRYSEQRSPPVYPEVAAAPTAQGYPAWHRSSYRFAEPTRRKVKTYTGGDVASQAPPVAPSTENVRPQNVLFTTRTHPARKLKKPPFPAIWPATTPPGPPVAPYPSWLPPPTLWQKQTYRTHNSGSAALSANQVQPMSAYTPVPTIIRETTKFWLRLPLNPHVYPASPPLPTPAGVLPAFTKPEVLKRKVSEFKLQLLPFEFPSEEEQRGGHFLPGLAGIRAGKKRKVKEAREEAEEIIEEVIREVLDEPKPVQRVSRKRRNLIIDLATAEIQRQGALLGDLRSLERAVDLLSKVKLKDRREALKEPVIAEAPLTLQDPPDQELAKLVFEVLAPEFENDDEELLLIMQMLMRL